VSNENVILDEDVLEFIKDNIKSPFGGGREVEFRCSDSGRVTIPYGPIRGVKFLEGIAPFVPSVLSTKAGNTVLSITRSWQFMERYYFDSDGSTFNFENARGEVDHNYKIEGIWKAGTGTISYLFLHINGATGGSLSNTGSAWVTSTGAGSSLNGPVIARVTETENSSTHRIECTFNAKTDYERLAISHDAETHGTSSSATTANVYTAKYHDTTTDIISLGLFSGSSLAISGTNILAGSYFDLYRKPELTGEKMKVWIY